MRRIAIVRLDTNRPALVLTRHPQLHLLRWVTVASIRSTVRGMTSEVRVGSRNGLAHGSVVSCDTSTTVPAEAVGIIIGLLFDDQEPGLARAIGEAFDLFIP